MKEKNWVKIKAWKTVLHNQFDESALAPENCPLKSTSIFYRFGERMWYEFPDINMVGLNEGGVTNKYIYTVKDTYNSKNSCGGKLLSFLVNVVLNLFLH